jgi:hypothetical protein
VTTEVAMSESLYRKEYMQKLMVWSYCVFQKQHFGAICLRDDLKRSLGSCPSLEALELDSRQ